MALIAVFLRTDVFILIGDVLVIDPDEPGIVLSRIVIGRTFPEVIHLIEALIQLQLETESIRQIGRAHV